MEPQNGSYLIGFVMERKYSARLVKAADVKVINDSEHTEMRDLYKLIISEEGKIQFEQIPLDSVDSIVK
ncbi:hypothetical protein GOV06_01350 [Candidatus Woesearchaeota archaeon]|nr:hypothetical protein [Candidatus Woesearchaeota archaeon]